MVTYIDATTEIGKARQRFALIEAANPQTRWKPPVCDYVNGTFKGKTGPCTHAKGHHGSDKPLRQQNSDKHLYFGLKVDTKTGAASFPTPPKRRYPAAIPEKTLVHIAACAALGLRYWSEAGIRPSNYRRHLWAVDDHQRAHLVEIDHRAKTVTHQCGSYMSGGTVADEYCGVIEKARRETYTTNDIGLMVQLDLETQEEPEMPIKTEPPPIPRKDTKRRPAQVARSIPPASVINAARGKTEEIRKANEEIRRAAHKSNADALNRAASPKPMTRDQAKALLAHDPDFYGDITSEALVDLLDDPSLKKAHAAIRRELKARGLVPQKTKIKGDPK